MNNNKIIIFGILVLVFGLAVAGCVSYSHTQAVRNETGVTVREVFIRDTGTTEWGNVRNVRARTDSEGRVLYRENAQGRSVVAFWDRYDMNNSTEITFFRDPSYGETPRGMKNQDIAMRDNNGLLYMKHNVPITYTTSQVPLFGQSTVINRSNPITFTVQDRLPMLFVVNQTGYSINLMSPTTGSIANNARTQFQPMEMNRPIDVVYSVGLARYTEQVTMNNADTTVTLTRRPPFVTIVNNTGNTVTQMRMRVAGTDIWHNQNMFGLALNEDGTVNTANASLTSVDLTVSVENRGSRRIWLGMVNIAPDRYDVRLDDVQGNTYIKRNVQINSDMSLTFTASDR